MHTNAAELASNILERLTARLNGAKPRLLGVLEAGPVIATHGGPAPWASSRHKTNPAFFRGRIAYVRNLRPSAVLSVHLPVLRLCEMAAPPQRRGAVPAGAVCGDRIGAPRRIRHGVFSGAARRTRTTPPTSRDCSSGCWERYLERRTARRRSKSIRNWPTPKICALTAPRESIAFPSACNRSCPMKSARWGGATQPPTWSAWCATRARAASQA